VLTGTSGNMDTLHFESDGTLWFSAQSHSNVSLA
jgi:streptogramin lyase